MTDTPYLIRLTKLYGTFLRQSDWFPSSRTPGNEWASGPFRIGVCREGYGSTRWYGLTECQAISPLRRYTDFFNTTEEAREAVIRKTEEWYAEILAVPPSEIPLLFAANDNLPPVANDNRDDRDALDKLLKRKLGG